MNFKIQGGIKVNSTNKLFVWRGGRKLIHMYFEVYQFGSAINEIFKKSSALPLNFFFFKFFFIDFLFLFFYFIPYCHFLIVYGTSLF